MKSEQFVELFKELYRAHGRKYTDSAEEKAMVYYERLCTIESEPLKAAFEAFILDNKLFPTIDGLKFKAIEIGHKMRMDGRLSSIAAKGCIHCYDGQVRYEYFTGDRWEYRAAKCAVCYRGEASSIKYLMQRGDCLFVACREVKAGVYIADPSSADKIASAAYRPEYTDEQLEDKFHRLGDFRPITESEMQDVSAQFERLKKQIDEKAKLMSAERLVDAMGKLKGYAADLASKNSCQGGA